MNTSVKIVVYLLTWLHMSAIFCCGLTVSNIEVSPTEPINGENATLKCEASDGYDPSRHSWIWQRIINGTLVDITANGRIAFLPVQQKSPTSYSNSMTIDRLEKSDEGTYLCVVVKTSDGNVVSNGGGEFLVNYPNEFPVCYPDGPADVTEGDSLSCKTVIEKRSPEVRLVDDPNNTQNWTVATVGESVSGSGLKKNVTIADDGLIFFCYSIVVGLNVTKALSCGIGPLMVTPLESPGTITTRSPPPPTTSAPLGPTTTGLPVAAIIGIAAGGSLLFLLVLFALCCGCNPKRCFSPKTYLLNFTDIFGSSPKEDDPHRDTEMDHNNLDAPPSSPPGDQRVFSFEGGVEDNPAVPPTEQNIYSDHSVPGHSTSQFVSDPNENWHEINLKEQINQALDDENEDY